MAIGEAGSITANSPTENAPITVTFTEPLTDPIIVLTATNNGGDHYVLRVTDTVLDGNGDTVSFTFIMEEWEYHDGPHGATEDINWIAIEEGTHQLADGRVIEAGFATATDQTSNVNLNGDFDTPPVIMTNVMSNNGSQTVDSDPFNITANSFDLALQEEQGGDQTHLPETVGFIAVQPGTTSGVGGATTHENFDETIVNYNLGQSYSNPIVVGETQTMNDTDPGTVVINGNASGDTVGVEFEEERSADGERNHGDETLGLLAFEMGLIICFGDGTQIDTPSGPRDIASLRAGDYVLTRDNGPKPIRWMGAKTTPLGQGFGIAPVVIQKDAFGPGIPERDLAVSPQHRILMQGWQAEMMFGQQELLVPAKSLLVNDRVFENWNRPEVTYYHMMFDQHEVVTSNGLASESLFPGDMARDALDEAGIEELFSIFPELRGDPKSYGPSARLVLKPSEGELLASRVL